MKAMLEILTVHDFFMLGASVWALVMIRRLWRGAPDAFQRFVLGCLCFSMICFIVAYAMRLSGLDTYEWEFFVLATLPMQYAVIVNLFRIDEKQREEECRNLRAASER